MKIAVITGASSGLGKEFTKQISKKVKGLDELWIIARREEKLIQLKESIKHIKCRVMPLDLIQKESFVEYERLLEKYSPKICMLINNAGYGKIGSFETIDIDEQLNMIELNNKSIVKITRSSLPYLYNNARIIQVASSAGFMPQPGFSVYAATKAFVISFGRGLNQELKDKNIKITSVCPGPVRTEFFDVAGGDVSMSIKKMAMVEADQVVAKALKDSAKGKEISTYGTLMNAFKIVAKIVPHSLILKQVNYYNSRDKE
ncbi:hypothetical protein EDC19_0693 [Natranaerovirga hydrolytica]|uniref:Short-subunit dehydrogenase n=1 Tax=Natranaerovirga hydrolytica TaxID=680378 RepID=A0A4R1N6L3_9FIRM|nr:SDR family NAD(P)-dependent oxidoreductase [Natranaerovirga hydrolytica]TCK98273.1 hypothetical protein EDC19_0693 [Natranaerovirga hydrolytica]